MKKVYVKPVAEVVVFDEDLCMITASDEGITPGGDASGDIEADANRHRGEWGNLWAED